MRYSKRDAENAFRRLARAMDWPTNPRDPYSQSEHIGGVWIERPWYHLDYAPCYGGMCIMGPEGNSAITMHGISAGRRTLRDFCEAIAFTLDVLETPARYRACVA
jgi:hypothetical protein